MAPSDANTAKPASEPGTDAEMKTDADAAALDELRPQRRKHVLDATNSTESPAKKVRCSWFGIAALRVWQWYPCRCSCCTACAQLEDGAGRTQCCCFVTPCYRGSVFQLRP